MKLLRRTQLRLVIRTVAVAAAALALPSFTVAQIIGAGSAQHAWFAIETTWSEDGVWTLYHAPSSLPPGSILRVRALPGHPDAMTAWDENVYIIYPAETDVDVEDRLRQVRSIATTALLDGQRFQYEPTTRERVLPPLKGAGRLVGFEGSSLGVFALLQDQDSRALYRMSNTDWEEVALPHSASSADRKIRLAPLSSGIAVLVESADQSRLWTLNEIESGWTEKPVAPTEGDRLLVAAGQMIEFARRGAGLVELRLFRGAESHALATVTNMPADFAVASLGDSVMLGWISPEDETRLMTEVISAITGQPLYRGPARLQPILTPRDLQYLALLLTAVLLMVLIFVLRPETGPGMEVSLPDGFVPATDVRRVVAILIDLVPFAALSAAAWGVPLTATFGIQIDVDGAGVWPLLTTLAAATIWSFLSEWLFGRTPGKLIVGCRTISKEGGRLTARQALVRNLVKFACPPLLALTLADPARRHPGDYFGGSIVVMRAPSDEEPGPGE